VVSRNGAVYIRTSVTNVAGVPLVLGAPTEQYIRRARLHNCFLIGCNVMIRIHERVAGMKQHINVAIIGVNAAVAAAAAATAAGLVRLALEVWMAAIVRTRHVRLMTVSTLFQTFPSDESVGSVRGCRLSV
jgi:hypothetical protein